MPKFLWYLGLLILLILAIFAFPRLVASRKYFGCVPINTRDHVNPALTAAFLNNQMISPLQGLTPTLTADRQKVLGIESQDKVIDINLKDRSLTARQGDSIIVTTPINIGLFAPTPEGQYYLTQKYLVADLAGGSPYNQTYFNLPNTPYNLYFTHDLALVGAYWTQNFGGTAGFGCIEVPLPTAETLYYWGDSPKTSSSPGTKIIIHH